jgi:hypothetical protein
VTTGYFTHITQHFYNYNRACRPRLEKLLYYIQGFLEVEIPADILNHFWLLDPGSSFASETATPLHNRFRSETITNS